MNRGTAIVRYFEKLFEGDAIAVGITLFFVLLGVGIGLLAWKFKRDNEREDRERRNKWLKKK